MRVHRKGLLSVRKKNACFLPKRAAGSLDILSIRRNQALFLPESKGIVLRTIRPGKTGKKRDRPAAEAGGSFSKVQDERRLEREEDFCSSDDS